MQNSIKILIVTVLLIILLLKHDQAFSQLNTAGSYVWNINDAPRIFNSKLQLSFVNSTTGFPGFGTVVAGGGYNSTQDGGVFQLYFPYNVQNGGNAPKIRLGLYNNQGWSAWSTFYTSVNANSPTIDWTAKNLIVFGNILVGKTSQTNSSYKLDVNGNIRANKVVVNTTSADYVFDSAYLLLTIDSLQHFIAVNHHLPDIEPARDLQIFGADLGKMQTLQLQKIEELTLYLIRQQETIKKQQSELEELKAEIEAVKKQIGNTFDFLDAR